MGLDFSEPGRGLVVNEVKGGLLIRFACRLSIRTVGFKENFRGGGVASKNGGRLDVEGFVGPLVVGGEGAEYKGKGGELKGGDGKVLDGAAEALNDKPGCLEEGESFLKAILFGLVPDFFFGDGRVR